MGPETTVTSHRTLWLHNHGNEVTNKRIIVKERKITVIAMSMVIAVKF